MRLGEREGAESSAETSSPRRTGAVRRPGVFAAGDTRHGSIKRVASAVGEGSMAVQLIHQYLAEER